MADVLTRDNELVYASFPVEKVEENEDGDLLVWGKASDGTVDGDLQIVDPDWSLKALQDWFDTGANVRVQHQAQRDPAGVGVELDGHYLKAKVVEKEAKRLVKAGALGCFSIGISRPEILHGRHPLDPEGKAIGGIITGRKDGTSRIPEVSLVDRGSNFNSKFQLVKAAADGSCEYVGKMIGADDTITKAAHDGGDLVSVDLPKNASISISPADFAKLHTLKQRLTASQAAEPDPLDAMYKAAEAQVWKRDIDTATRRRLAKEGKALPDGSYPIENAEDLHNAAILARSGHGNVAAAKRLIARRAKDLGVPNPLKGGKTKGGDASKGAAVSGEPDITVNAEGAAADPAELAKATAGDGPAAPEALKADPGDEDGDGALHHDDGDDDDTDSDADALDKAAMPKKGGKGKKAAMTCGNCGKKCKPSASFCGKCGRPMKASAHKADTPGEGVTGTAAADIQPAPMHREPDGPAFEALEHDAHMHTTPDPASCEVKAAARHRTLGVPYDQGWLHDILCPAYDPADVAKHYPHRDLSLVDTDTWQAKAFDLAAKAPLHEMGAAMDLFQHARTLKAVTPGLAHDILGEAHKAFRDANPGPATAPTPGELTAARFSRPLITAGHAAPSPGHDAPHSNPVHAEHQSASMYQRGPLTSGHAADSPGNASTRPEPVPAPAVPGVPSAVSTADIQRHNAAQAMNAMHDHIAASFPDLCPMYGPGHAGQQPSGARPVAAGIGGPVPHGAMKADSSEDEPQVTKTAGADPARKARKLEKQLRKAREAAGLPPLTAYQPQPVALKAATGQVRASVDPDVIKSAVAEATSALAADLTATRTELAELRKVADAIADQPDPRVEAYRGPVFNKTSAPAGPTAPPGRVERAQDATVFALFDQWRNSTDPGQREVAWNALKQFHGLDLSAR